MKVVPSSSSSVHLPFAAAAPKSDVGGGPLSDSLRPDQGEAPVSRAALRITEQLRDLKSGELLCVANDGTTYLEKLQFIAKSVEPLVSFFKTDNRSVIVYPGIPPRNPTYCSSANAENGSSAVQLPLGSRTPELLYPVVLRSGDTLQLSRTAIQIPDRVLTDPKTPQEKLAQVLATAQASEEVQLGRIKVRECPGDVSRVHCTVKILERKDNPDGTCSLEVEVVPGIPAREPIALQRPSGSHEQITARVTVEPGEKVFLGKRLGTVTIPYPAGSIDEASESICDSFMGGQSDIALKALATFEEGGNREFTQRMAGECRVSPLAGQETVKGRTLQQYICKGIELISANRHEDAIKHFRQSDVLEMMGYHFEENNVFLLGSLDERAVLENITGVAERSWFLVDKKLVYPSFGSLRKDLVPANERERENLAHWRKEIALIYAEEYTHALQDALGALVSRKAAFLRRPDREADVALFLQEQGVRLSNEYVINRYPQRREALLLAGGLQTPETQQLFQGSLARTPLGGTLSIGRGVHGELGERGFSIPTLNTAIDSTVLQMASKAHAALNPVEATVTKRQDGSFGVRSSSIDSTLFVPDGAGYYTRAVVGKEYVLEPRTPIYVGRTFRLELRE